MSEDYKELLQKYDLLARQYENLKNQYITVLDLVKKNSDAYEYCLSNLEKEIEELRRKNNDKTKTS
jgi:gas vesicle protein